MARFWRQKGHGRRGIYWCEWNRLYELKDKGSLSFLNLENFNLSLLAKQS